MQKITDVPKKGDDASYAYLACRGDVVISDGGAALRDTSVFQAEVVAMQATLLWLISNPNRLRWTMVKLWSDSQSILQSVFSLKPSLLLVEDTIKLLLSENLLCQIELAWVCGHSSITGKGVVDGMVICLSLLHYTLY